MQKKNFFSSNKMASKRNSENLLNEPVPDIKEPVLKPQPAPSYFQRLRKYPSDKRESVKKYAKYRWNRWVNWLLDYNPPIPKVIDKASKVVKKILKLYKSFEIIENKSALKNLRLFIL